MAVCCKLRVKTLIKSDQIVLHIQSRDKMPLYFKTITAVNSTYRRVAEIQIFEKTYLIVIKDETGLKFKMNDSTLFLTGSYAQKLVASFKNGEITQYLQKTET